MQVSFGPIDTQAAESPQAPLLEATGASEDFREVLEDAEFSGANLLDQGQKDTEDHQDLSEASEVASELLLLDPSLPVEADSLTTDKNLAVGGAQQEREPSGGKLPGLDFGMMDSGGAEHTDPLSLAFSEPSPRANPSSDPNGTKVSQEPTKNAPLDLNEVRSGLEEAPLEKPLEEMLQEEIGPEVPEDLLDVQDQGAKTIKPPKAEKPVEAPAPQNTETQSTQGDGVNYDPGNGAQFSDPQGQENPSSGGQPGNRDNANAAAFGLGNVTNDSPSTDVAQASAPATRDPITSDEIIKQVKLNVRTGTSRINFIVDPPELGRLNIQLTLRNGRLTGQITAESGAVEKALLAGLDGLKATMREAGVHVDSLEVQTKNNPQDQSDWAPASDERRGETQQGKRDRQEGETSWVAQEDSAESKTKQTYASNDGINIIA